MKLLAYIIYTHIEAFWEVNILRTWNTYNGDSDLSQILQGADVEINDEQYVLIQKDEK